jgi:hypothetical protein
VLRDWYQAGITKIKEVNRILNEAADCAAIPRPGAPWETKYDMRPPQRPDPKGDKGKASKEGAHANPKHITKRDREGALESKDKGGEHGKGEDSRDGEACYGCGRTGHKADKCIYLHPEKPHPHANTEKVPWADSTMGKRWLTERGKPVLAGRETIDQKPWQSLPIWAVGLTTAQIDSRRKEYAERPAKGGHPSATKKRKCTDDSHTVAAVHTDPPRITIPCRITLTGSYTNTRFLLDSGALNGNYVSEETAALLRAASVKEDPSEGRRVCVAIGDVCRPSGSVFTFLVDFLTNVLKPWNNCH